MSPVADVLGLIGVVAYWVLVGLAVWCAVALLVALGYHLIRRRERGGR